MSGLCRVEPVAMDAALVVMSAVSAPALRGANLAWLAEEFAMRNPPAEDHDSLRRSYAPPSDQALADAALAATAGALIENGNPGLAVVYAGRIRDTAIRETAMAAVNPALPASDALETSSTDSAVSTTTP